MLETIGWVGSILFALCGLPQAIETYRVGHGRGISWAFLLMWFFGEVLTVFYVLPKGRWPLLFNYLGNIIFILFIMKYKIWERKK